MKRLLLIVFCVLIEFSVSAQSKYEEKETFKTQKDLEWDHGRKVAHRKFYNTIYKKTPKGLLLGNKCFEDKTKKMGFIYESVKKGETAYSTEFGRLRHNFGVKIKLFFTRGPFWKFKVNKARKRCRQLTGDFYG